MLEVNLFNPLYRQMSRRDRIPAEEWELLIGSFSAEKSYGVGEDLVVQGSRPAASQLLVEGFAGRYKGLADGSRQITVVHVAGDFMDLHGYLLKTLAHGVVAMSDCRVALMDHAAVRRIAEVSPHLSRMLWLDTLIDGAVHREWLVAMGRLKTDAHLAHFICEIYVKLEIIGRTEGYGFSLPFTQQDLADILGNSVVHVNRSLQILRKLGLVTWKGKNVHIDDWDKLAALGQFDPMYLSIVNEPR